MLLGMIHTKDMTGLKLPPAAGPVLLQKTRSAPPGACRRTIKNIVWMGGAGIMLIKLLLGKKRKKSLLNLGW